jgi:uncharacterized membrane protein
MRAYRAFIGIAFFATALASALASTPATAPAGDSNACALLSGLDVEKAVGVPVKDGLPRLRIGSLTSCRFATERGGEVGILVRSLPGADWLSAQEGRMNRGVRIGSYREVTGIGDRSFLYDMRSAGAVLCIFGAEYYLQISLLRTAENSRTPAVLRKLATTALQRLRVGIPAARASGVASARPYRRHFISPSTTVAIGPPRNVRP